MIAVSGVFCDKEIQYKPASTSPRGNGVFIVVKTSQEVYGVSRPTHTQAANRFLNLPDMWAVTPENSKLTNGKDKPHYVTMTDDLCHWLFRLNVEKWNRKPFASEAEYRAWHKTLRRDNQFIQWWVSLMKGDRSHTNRYGSDTCWDPISGENKGAEPMRYFQLVTGRAILKVLKIRNDKFGVACINFSKGDYRQYNPIEHWWLFDEPLMTGRKIISQGKDGKIVWDESLLTKYPQFEPTLPVMPVMLTYDSVGFVDAGNARLLGDDEATPEKYR